ncbi:TetR/AcrR family transcriptional regulator [Streptomyces sp. NPDC001663]|uniref:TetR/AcrR family transcriptional regulator n=1 Tax=Streptomyces sp. NPDC001663 TaxID=3364597 RepID=UPI00369D4F5B
MDQHPGGEVAALAGQGAAGADGLGDGRVEVGVGELKEGYAAVGVRRVAREAEVAPALVLYYFRTLDDLFLAVLRRRGDEKLEQVVRRLDGPQPIRALWQDTSHPGNALTTEFNALANHRKAIRAERYREVQLEALT